MTWYRGKPFPPALHPANLSLNRRFWIAIVIVMACSLALGSDLVARYQEDLAASRSNLAGLETFRLSMNVANRLSSERGPTNLVLTADSQSSASAWQLLQASRAATDAALAQAAATATLAPDVPPLRQALQRARQTVDALAGEPLAAHDTARVTGAIEAMFGVYDAAQPIVGHSMAALQSSEGDLLGPALAIRMLSELRDSAGRLGSYLVIAMIQGKPMDTPYRAAFNQTEGRVQELWRLVAPVAEASHDPAVLSAYRAVATRFAGDGMTLLQQTFEESRVGRYSTTPAAFTATVVPSFTTLEALRDTFINATVRRLRAGAAAAQRWMVIVAAATGLALLFELLLLLASQTMLFRPLLAARDRVVALANDQLGEIADSTHPHGEIRELYVALASLRAKLIERVALTERFRLQAETDGLTGVLNRRALDEVAERLMRMPGPRRIDLIMLDIDHFKRVNDTYGHTAGDEVLKETAHRLRATLRSDDVLARFGGEEFAVILADEGKNAPDIA